MTNADLVKQGYSNFATEYFLKSISISILLDDFVYCQD